MLIIICRLLIGQKDSTLENNIKFSQKLNTLGINHEFLIIPNITHDTMSLLFGMGESNWDYYNKALVIEV